MESAGVDEKNKQGKLKAHPGGGELLTFRSSSSSPWIGDGGAEADRRRGATSQKNDEKPMASNLPMNVGKDVAPLSTSFCLPPKIPVESVRGRALPLICTITHRALCQISRWLSNTGPENLNEISMMDITETREISVFQVWAIQR